MFLSILFALALIGSGLALFNAVTILTINARKGVDIPESVAVLIPMRNEANHVTEVIQSVCSSELLPSLQIYALNDSSTDGTGQLLAAQAERLTNLVVLDGKPLESGWMGKPFACYQLGERAMSDGAEFLVFLDADTRISPKAIAASISELKAHRWDFISPHPREIASSPLARLIQPLMQWSWFVSVPVRLGIALRISSMAIANGQFIIVRSSAYRQIGGHAAVQNQVLEDLEIARSLVKAGCRGGVAVAAAVADCQMYENDSDLRAGYSKSLWRAFGSPVGATIAALLLVSTQTLPFLLALTGSIVAWKIYAVNALAHLIVALKTRSNPINTFAHPLAIIFLVAMIIDSFVKRINGKLQWKDRSIA